MFRQAGDLLGEADTYQRLANSYLFRSPQADLETIGRNLNLEEMGSEPDIGAFSSIMSQINLGAIVDPEIFTLVLDYYVASLFAAAGAYEPLIQEEIDYDPEILRQAEDLYRRGSELFDSDDCGAATPLLNEAFQLYGSIDYGAGEVRALAVRARCQVQQHDALGAFSTALEAMRVAVDLPVGDSTSERLLAARESLEQGRFADAESGYLGLIEEYRAADDLSGLIKVALDLGALYALMERYVEGEARLLEALDLLDGQDPQDEYRSFNIAAARHNLAHLSAATGRPWDAVSHHCKTLPIFRALAEPSREVASLSGLGLALRMVGRYDDALAILEQGQTLQAGLSPEPEIEGDLFNNIGYVHFTRRDYEQANTLFQKALQRHEEAQNPRKILEVLNNIASAESSQGQFTEALKTYERALDLTAAYDLPSHRIKIHGNRAAIQFYRGDYQGAIKTYFEVLPMVERRNDRPTAGRMHLNLGAAYLGIGKPFDARNHFRQSLRIAEEIGDPEAIAETSSNLGALYSRVGRSERAAPHFARALEVWRDLGNPRAASRPGLGLAFSAVTQGDFRTALETGEKALAASRAAGNQVEEMQLLFVIGASLLGLGTLEDAGDHLQEAVDLAEEFGMATVEVVGRALLSWSHLARGRRAEAWDETSAAIARLESQHGAMTVPAVKSGFLDQTFLVYDLAVLQSAEAGQVEDAFRYAEKGRARSFLDQLANQRLDLRQGATADLVAREQDLKRHLQRLQREGTKLLETPLGNRDEERIASLRRDLEQGRARYESLLTELGVTSPEYSQMVRAEIIGLPELQSQLLDDRTTLVAYYVTGASAHEALPGGAWAWVIDRESYQLVPLDVGSDVLQANVRHLRNEMSHKDFDETTAAFLYEKLVEPLNPYIRHRNVILVPHGALHYLPFGALWNDREKRFLLEERTLTLAPSATALRYLGRKRSPFEGRVLVLGNPDGSLADAEAEAESVAAIYKTKALLGGAASEGALRSRAGEIDLLHVAAHASYDSRRPFFSYVALAPDHNHDGRLEVHEIYELDLSGADLVVLSTCESALGEQSRGDELVGLTRAFLYAGSPAVLSTLWGVEDAAAGELMRRFHRHVGAGVTTAEALRRAQLEVRKLPGWGSPYFWAAFALHGEGRGPVVPEPEEALAVLTSFSGDVTIESGGERRAASPVRRLAAGDRVELGPGARAALVCRGDTVLELDRTETLTRGLCTGATRLPRGSYSVVVPRAGRIQRVFGSYVPVPSTREPRDGYGRFPVVLSPRRTALLEPRPTIRWAEVADAESYEIRWNGPGFPTFSRRRDELRCRGDEILGESVTSCEMPWSLEAPPLQEGGTYFLSVGAWLEADLRPRTEDEPNRIAILDPKRAAALRTVVDRIRALPDVDPVTRHQILAGFHLQDGVYAEAIPAYREAAEAQPSAKIYTTLGDSYRQIELYRFATASYEIALRLAQDDAERAAAQLGLGLVDFAWRRYREASARFEHAREMFAGLGLAEEAAEAAGMQALARRRVRP